MKFGGVSEEKLEEILDKAELMEEKLSDNEDDMTSTQEKRLKRIQEKMAKVILMGLPEKLEEFKETMDKLRMGLYLTFSANAMICPSISAK